MVSRTVHRGISFGPHSVHFWASFMSSFPFCRWRKWSSAILRDRLEWNVPETQSLIFTLLSQIWFWLSLAKCSLVLTVYKVALQLAMQLLDNKQLSFYLLTVCLMVVLFVYFVLFFIKKAWAQVSIILHCVLDLQMYPLIHFQTISYEEKGALLAYNNYLPLLIRSRRHRWMFCRHDGIEKKHTKQNM